MKFTLRQATLPLALAATLLGSATWSNASYACSSEPVMSSICIMAAARTAPFDYYVLANGTLLQVNQYQALYSLIGTTYGGTANQNFNLPNLSGRVIVGSGQYTDSSGTKLYQAGQVGGTMATALNGNQLPAHYHTLAKNIRVTTGLGSLTVSMSGLSATAAAGTLAGSTNLTGITATGESSSLTLNASNAAAGSGNSNPAGAYLTNQGSGKMYNASAPSKVAMAAGSISGTVPVTFAGSANVTITGTPSVTISGSPSLAGAPSVQIDGATDVAGASAAVSLMQPYVVMNYYIATQGYYPTYQ